MFAVCSALNHDEIVELESISDQRAVEPRKTLFREGEAADAVYTITSGTIRLQKDLADGRRQVVGFAVPGDFLGIVLPEKHTLTAEAITGATFCRFDRGRYLALVDAKPALLRRLHEEASHELGIARDHMMLLGRRRAEERVAAFLLGWRERMAALNGRSATLPLPMGRQDIADHLGLTIETVSRTFARWMRDRIVLDVPDGIRILDEARIRAILTD
jgi:CRP/FNR family transcriptional regulator